MEQLIDFSCFIQQLNAHIVLLSLWSSAHNNSQYSKLYTAKLLYSIDILYTTRFRDKLQDKFYYFSFLISFSENILLFKLLSRNLYLSIFLHKKRRRIQGLPSLLLRHDFSEYSFSPNTLLFRFYIATCFLAAHQFIAFLYHVTSTFRTFFF